MTSPPHKSGKSSADGSSSSARGRLRFGLMEFSGGFGDLGTFLPLAVGMAVTSGMDLGVILVFAGLASIFAGVLFGLPVPVQPMKAIAAVAIAQALNPGAIAAAGLITGLVILILGLSGTISKLEKIVPLSVVRGIQVGVAIKLVMKAVEYASATPLIGFNSVSTAVTLAVLMFFMRRSRRFPGALILLSIGIAISFTEIGLGTETAIIGLPTFHIVLPSTAAWLDGLVYGAAPQIPLTILNSVIAVCALSGDLFPRRPMKSRTTAVSVGVINLVTCWFGAMPMCHGSGGLAAQYHFGARTGGATVMIGILKLTVGLLFGSAAIAAMRVFPGAILGVMLFFAGIELALPARDQTDRAGIAVTLITAIAIVATNTLAGFLLGALASLILQRKSMMKHPPRR